MGTRVGRRTQCGECGPRIEPMDVCLKCCIVLSDICVVQCVFKWTDGWFPERPAGALYERCCPASARLCEPDMLENIRQQGAREEAQVYPSGQPGKLGSEGKPTGEPIRSERDVNPSFMQR